MCICSFALNNKGKTIINLGGLQVELSQKQDARKSWQVELAALTRSLEIGR
jgi:hypothetical protein